MGCKWYLAMNGWEMANCQKLPEHMAYLGCTFSAAGGGITPLPEKLPAGTVLIFSDLIPMADHDPETVADQLQGPWESILLDLQKSADYRPLLDALCTRSCPVVVTEMHASHYDCGVFLSPPLNIPIRQAVMPWQGRRLWADGAVGVQHFTVTQVGCQVSEIFPADQESYQHETPVFCRYRRTDTKDSVRFSLYRDTKHLEKWVQAAREAGIEAVVSLYGEIKKK